MKGLPPQESVPVFLPALTDVTACLKAPPVELPRKVCLHHKCPPGQSQLLLVQLRIPQSKYFGPVLRKPDPIPTPSSHGAFLSDLLLFYPFPNSENRYKECISNTQLPVSGPSVFREQTIKVFERGCQIFWVLGYYLKMFIIAPRLFFIVWLVPYRHSPTSIVLLLSEKFVSGRCIFLFSLCGEGGNPWEVTLSSLPSAHSSQALILLYLFKSW